MKSLKESILTPFPSSIKIPFLLGIKHVHNDDLFICSYPKSGNTWLRIIVANILFPEENIHLNNIENYIQGIEVAKETINNSKEKRIIKSHYPYFYLYPKTIYIYRDYRDVLVSYYYHQKSLAMYKDSFSSFIKDKRHTETPYKSWVQHTQLAFNFKKANPDSILILSYEDLHNKIEESIKKISQFINQPIPSDINSVIENSSFKNLNTLENLHGSKFKQGSSLPFFRKGIVADWKNVFSEDDLLWLYDQPEIKMKLQELNYYSG